MLSGAAILVCAAACAQPPQASGPPAPAKQEEKGKEDKKPPEEKVSQTKHTIQIGGKDVKYTATAGTMLLKKEDGTATASIFYIAYIKDDMPDTTKRPLTFAFNGGPGSSSVWLQLGALGPKRVAMDPEGNALPPPYKLVDNEYSILDLTDLVFIDPVSTGFSRAIPEQDRQELPRDQWRPGVGSQLHPSVHHAQQPVDVAQIPGRRKLRHHARGEPFRLSAAAHGLRAERHHVDFGGVELRNHQLRLGQRSALHSVPAHLHGHRLVSQETAAGPDGQPEQGAGGEPAVRLARIHAWR